MRDFWGELRLALRTLARARGFTAAVIVTLALAIALEATVMAVVNAYLIRSLPYPAASRLYSVRYARPGEAFPTGLAELDWNAVSNVVEHPISWDLDVFYLIRGDHPEAARGAWVTRGFMQGLGIQPIIGRSFAEEEFTPGGPQVALISDALWQRRFGGDSAVIGRHFEAYVSDRPSDPDIFTIVGVLPANFWHLNPYTEVLTPLRARSYPYLLRLREGVPRAVAERRITDLVQSGRATLTSNQRVELLSVHEQYARSVKPLLVAIGAAVSLVLLIACANVVFLALIRGMRRQKEVAVRLALGAGRAQVARLLVAESLLLAATAAVAGSFLAVLLVRNLAPAIQQQLGRPAPGGAGAVTIDAGVAAAIGALTLLIVLGLTLAPLLVTWRPALLQTLRRGRSSGAEGRRGRRARFGLIALEVAGSLALLTGCGLMVRTVRRMVHVDLGLQPAGVMTATLGLRERSYPDAAPRIAFYERLPNALRQMPGVLAAELSSPSPLLEFEPRPIRADEAAGIAAGSASVRAITPGYFSALGIPLLQGRPFSELDRGASEPVAVLSETAARRLWPNGSAIGKRVRAIERGIMTGDTMTATRTVVGVVEDVRQSPTDEELAEVYVPLLQSPSRFAAIVLRTTGARASWVSEVRRVLGAIDPEIPVSPLQELTAIVDEQLARPRFLAALFAGFGLFATLLALLGVYGVIAYAVKQREREIAIRMAVGADAAAIKGLFLREGTLVLLAGIAAGVLGAVGIGRLLQAQLYGVGAIDPATLLAASLGLGLACIAAVWWPCRRASAVEPASALKEE